MIDTGNTAWLLMSTALVMLMLPGLALFYGGLVRAKNVLSTIMHSFFGLALGWISGNEQTDSASLSEPNMPRFEGEFAAAEIVGTCKP